MRQVILLNSSIFIILKRTVRHPFSKHIFIQFGSKNSTSGQQCDTGSFLRGWTVSVIEHAQGRHALPTVAGNCKTTVDQKY